MTRPSEGRMRKLRPIKGEHDFSLTDEFSSDGKVITQTRYFRAGDIVIAVGELNHHNRWNDRMFDAACDFLTNAWNSAETSND